MQGLDSIVISLVGRLGRLIMIFNHDATLIRLLILYVFFSYLYSDSFLLRYLNNSLLIASLIESPE